MPGSLIKITRFDTQVFSDTLLSKSPAGGDVPSTPSRGRLSRQASYSKDGAMRKRSTSRRMSSFDYLHINSVTSIPDITRLESIDVKAVPWWTSQRFRLAIVCFFGFVVLYAQRVNMSIAIVTMVDHGFHDMPRGINTTGYSNITEIGSHESATQEPDVSQKSSPKDVLCPELAWKQTRGEFKWDKGLQGLMLGAFFWGYMVLQVFGGTISEKYGAKKVIAFGMVPVAVLTILTPVCVRANPYLFMVVRILIGVGESVMYPAVQALWARWAPPNERSRLIGFSCAGGQFGNAMIFPIGGFLCAYGFDGGWPSVFYVIGACGLLWCIAWIVCVHDSPADDKNISAIEKMYIESSIGERATRTATSTPWKAIFTSRPVWAIVVAHMCGNYGAYMLLTQIPTYMKEVLKFDIKANGLYSMLPYLTFWAFITVSSMLADFLISHGILSIGWTRKLMSVLGMVGPASFLVGTGFMECTQPVAAIVCLTLAVGLCGFHFAGFFINHGDIAPPYAGTLFGISNTAATVPGILAPFVVSAMTGDGTREQWQSTFYVAAGVYVFGAVVYVVFGSGEVQTWAEATHGMEDDEKEAGVGFGLQDIHETANEDEVDAEEKLAERMMKEVNIELK